MASIPILKAEGYYECVAIFICNMFLIQGKHRPAMKDLINLVVPYIGGHKWYMLGFQLLNQQYEETLMGIRENQKASEDSCLEMFKEWLRTDEKASWGKLIEGLKAPSVKLNQLAEKLQKMLATKPVC